MNAVFAAVLLAFVATCSGTAVVSSTIGGSQLLYSPSAIQYVAPSSSLQYQYVQQPQYVSASVPVNYASSAVIPSTYSSVYGLQYPYAYTYGNYGYSLLKK